MAAALAAWLESEQSRGARRWIFGIQMTLTVLLTLWPKLQVPNVVPRTDLVGHLTAFGTWMIAATWLGMFGPIFSARNIVLTGILGAAFGAVDEGLQAIPFIHRTCALDDWGCNVLGIAVGGVLLAVLGRMRVEPVDS
jgi:hypothetical protein